MAESEESSQQRYWSRRPRGKQEETDRSRSPIAKKTRMDEPMESGNKGAGKSSHSDAGANGLPIELSHAQHTRKVDKYTVKYAGTTWVVMGTDGTNNNLWSNFPWEFIQHAVNSNEVNELCNKYLYWKATHIGIEWKNPICKQEISSAGGTVTSGLNTSAQLYGYLDDMYLTGVATRPQVANDSTDGIVNYYDRAISWNNNGETAGTPVVLPTLDMASTVLRHNFPDVKAIGCSAGQSMDFGWNIHSPYWRATGDFQCTPNDPDGVNNDRLLLRWDEHCGMIAKWTNTNEGTVFVQECPRNMDGRPDAPGGINGTWIQVSSGDQSERSGGMPFMASDPIPRMWLQLQPQSGGLVSGSTPSQVQVQFEVTVTLACTGRVPRMAEHNFNSLRKQGGRFGTGREAANTVPIFRQVHIKIDEDLD